MTTGPVPPGAEPEAYDRLRRRVLWSMPSGLYVLGARAGERRNLMTLNWATQVALEPKLVAVSVERTARTHALVAESRVFTLSLPARADRTVVRRFVKPVSEIDVDEEGNGTMQGEAVRASRRGVPVLAGAAAWLECELADQLEAGSHTLFVGEVVDCGFGPADAPAPAAGERLEVLRMEDTRMNYGG
ncbi:MAG TPA: flavin reductase family protein [Acidimicrobiales bacterium]|nr:flavin reductase family protein [Acidimicrobiales bacterium]